jgi:hypothetical protein
MAYASIRPAIVEGRYRPGRRLVGFQLSHTPPVREARGLDVLLAVLADDLETAP